MSYFGSSTQRSWPKHKPTLNINNVLLLTFEHLSDKTISQVKISTGLKSSCAPTVFLIFDSAPVCLRQTEWEESVSLPVFLRMGGSQSEWMCRTRAVIIAGEPAGRLQWQPVISAPHTLKIPSRWHPFVPLPSPPFSSHQLCSTYSKMSLLLTRQSHVLLLPLNVAARKNKWETAGCCAVLVILNSSMWNAVV